MSLCALVSSNPIVVCALVSTCEIKFTCGQQPCVMAATTYYKLISMTDIGDITAMAL